MSKSGLDAGIPILTEVIEAPPAECIYWSAQPARQQEAGSPVEPADIAADTGFPPDIDDWLNAEWSRLEHKIGGRILQQVMQRLESEIELRVRDSLAEVLQVAVESLSSDIKYKLQDTLQTAISEAVKDEISRMQTAKS